jgi:hypothetical protein
LGAKIEEKKSPPISQSTWNFANMYGNYCEEMPVQGNISQRLISVYAGNSGMEREENSETNKTELPPPHPQGGDE